MGTIGLIAGRFTWASYLLNTNTEPKAALPQGVEGTVESWGFASHFSGTL